MVYFYVEKGCKSINRLIDRNIKNAHFQGCEISPFQNLWNMGISNLVKKNIKLGKIAISWTGKIPMWQWGLKKCCNFIKFNIIIIIRIIKNGQGHFSEYLGKTQNWYVMIKNKRSFQKYFEFHHSFSMTMKERHGAFQNRHGNCVI